MKKSSFSPVQLMKSFTRFFYSNKFPPIWLSIFRVGTGFILLASFLSIGTDFSRLYHPNGILDIRLLKLDQHTTAIPSLFESANPYVRTAYPLLCLLLMAGLSVRACAAMLLFLHGTIFMTQYALYSYGFDYIAASCLFYCLLFPVNRYHSLDGWLFKLKPAKEETFWLRWLQLHVCIIYFFAGIGKLLGNNWRNGEALWKALTQPGFESTFKPDLHGLAAYPWIWVLAGQSVFLLEVSYPLFIWLKPTRKYWLWGIVGLHLSIALFMGLYFFSAIMILLNLCTFYYPYLMPANQKQISIPMVSPLSPLTATDETRGKASGLIQIPREDMT
ncbi:Vitamin K-dependent gamma-carboxylase [bacterium A37T11]|nr:Vitamin K-dependent gamma-carboxylase [bacterium A37T11]